MLLIILSSMITRKKMFQSILMRIIWEVSLEWDSVVGKQDRDLTPLGYYEFLKQSTNTGAINRL